MERATVDGLTLEYVVSGRGEPVVLIHGALIADTFRPLLAEPSLVGRYQLILYHRRSYAGSTRSSGPISIAQQATDCRALLAHLGVERAHVVGHSYGGSTGQAYRDALVRGEQRYREADAAVVVDEFLQARWPGYRVHLDHELPGAFAQAVADAGTSFETELPSLLDWRFGAAEARQITQPVLSVLGGESEALWARFGETHRLLLTGLPHAEGFVLPGATHFGLVEHSRGLAEALADFYERHPFLT